MYFRLNLKMKAIAALLIASVVFTSAAKLSPKMKYKEALEAKSIQCDVCTFIITEIDKILVSAETQEDIIQAIEKLCAGLDGVFPGAGQACDSIVETYLPQIIEGLVQNQLSPAAVCGTLTLCP